MPTLMQKRLIKNLKTSKNLKEAGERAGYSYKARNIYRGNTKKHIADALKCDPKSIIAHYEALYNECMLSDDKPTAKAILDSLCRINAMFTDKTQNKTEVTTKDQAILDSYRSNRLTDIIPKLNS